MGTGVIRTPSTVVGSSNSVVEDELLSEPVGVGREFSMSTSPRAGLSMSASTYCIRPRSLTRRRRSSPFSGIGPGPAPEHLLGRVEGAAEGAVLDVQHDALAGVVQRAWRG